MDEGPSPTSAMMNTSGGSWLFGHSTFGSIHDAALGPLPSNTGNGGNGVGGGQHGHPQSVSPFSSSPSGFDDRNSQLISFSQNVSPTDISLAFDNSPSKHFTNIVTSSSPHHHQQVVQHQQQQQQQQQHHHLVHPVCSSTPTMTTLTSPSALPTGDDNGAQQLFQQQQQRHIGDDGQPKMEYSPYGTSQVMQAYTPDLGDGSVSQQQAVQGYSGSGGPAKEEPMYSSPNDGSDVSGANVGTSSSMATLADYNQVCSS